MEGVSEGEVEESAERVLTGGRARGREGGKEGGERGNGERWWEDLGMSRGGGKGA